MNIQGSHQYRTMAAEDTRETECLVKNKSPEGVGGTQSKKAAYSRNLKAFRNNPRGTSKNDLLERSYSAAYLMGSRKSKEAILGIKKNATPGGVKLEVRMPYGFHHNDDNLDDTKSLTDHASEQEGEDAPEKPLTTLPASLGLLVQASSSKRDNKMSLDELIASNHSKIHQRRRRRHQRKHHKSAGQGGQGRMELRKTLSSGRIRDMSQAMSPTDIFGLKESLHGVQRNRQDTAKGVTSDGLGNEEEEIPGESQATSCYEYTVVDEDDYKEVREDDESSYEVFSYDSSSCTSSFLKSDNGSAAAGMDPVNFFNDADDASQDSGFSIEMHTEHCHSSITAEDWESLFEESFAMESVMADASVDYYEESVSTFFDEKGIDKSDHIDPVLGYMESATSLLVEEVAEESIDEVIENGSHKHSGLGCRKSESTILVEEVMENSSHKDPALGNKKSETTVLVEEVIEDSTGEAREHSDEEVSEHPDCKDTLLDCEETNSSPIDEGVTENRFLNESVLDNGESPIHKKEGEEGVIGYVELRAPLLGHGGSGPMPTAKEKHNVVIDGQKNEALFAFNEPIEVKDVDEKVVIVAPAKKYRVSNTRFFIPNSTSGGVVADRIAQQRVQQEIHGAIAAASSPPSLPAITQKGNVGRSNATKRKPQRVAALIAMFEKNCQS